MACEEEGSRSEENEEEALMEENLPEETGNRRLKAGKEGFGYKLHCFERVAGVKKWRDCDMVTGNSRCSFSRWRPFKGRKRRDELQKRTMKEIESSDL